MDETGVFVTAILQENIMNLLHLEYFENVATTQNISKSANQLMISQPALSAAIKALETELGYKLFDRTGRTITLNDNGKNFLHAARTIFRVIDESRLKANLENVSQKRDEYMFTSNIMGPILANVLSLYSISHPDVTLLCRTTDQIKEEVYFDSVHFILGMDYSYTRNRYYVELDSFGYKAVLHRKHPLAGRDHIDVNELAEYPFVFYKPGKSTPNAYTLCLKNGFVPDVAFICDNKLNMLSLLLQNKEMVSLMPAPDANILAATGKFSTPIVADDISRTGKIYFSWLPAEGKPQSYQDFIDLFLKEYGVDESSICYNVQT